MLRYLATLTIVSLSACAYLPQPVNSGVGTDGRLRPCPAQPHCVSSLDTDKHHIAPLPWSPDAIDAAAQVLKQMPRTRIVTHRGNYLHAEVTSALFRFVDDVELLAEPDAGIIAVRSSSRIGYWDGGVNRARVEALRKALSETR